MKKALSLTPIVALLAMYGMLQPLQTTAQALIHDFIPGSNTYSNINEMKQVRFDLVYFNNNSELWKTDGTCEGTQLIKDFDPGYPHLFTPIENNKVFFSALDVDHGYELWATSGTEATTYMVKDIQSGNGDANPDHLCAHHNILYFAATTQAGGEELWRSDGTDAGTYMVINLRPGSNSSNPSNLVIFKDTLFFVATTSIGPALWKTDGTAAGTVLVKDFVPSSTLGAVGYLKVAGNQLFMRVNDNVNGAELWVSDGSTAGTQMVKDIFPGSPSGVDASVPFDAVGNILYFPANDGVNGEELWRSDGTALGTYLLKDIYPGNFESYISEIVHTSNYVFFNALRPDVGDELWRTDGTPAGTVLVKDINPAPSSSSSPKVLTPIDNEIFFRAFDDVKGHELWRSDGSAINTQLIKDIEPGVPGSFPSKLTRVNNDAVFIAETSLSGEELWSTGPAPSGPAVDAQVDAIIPENCHGEKTGAIYITVTAGNCPFVYQWTGPYNSKYYTEDLTNLWAGTYNLTITDAKGTTKVLTCVVGEPMSLTANFVNQTPPDCEGNLGSFTIQAQGGVSPFEYLWDNGVMGSTQNNIPFPGESYNVTITDANGCTVIRTFSTHAELPNIPLLRVNHPVTCYGDQALIFAPIGTEADPGDKISSIQYHWEAGPGGLIVSDPNQLEIVVKGAATYTLTATASTSHCTQTQIVVVGKDSIPPLANAGPHQVMNCSTDPLQLTGLASANGASYTQLQIEWASLSGGGFVSSPYELSPQINQPGVYVLNVVNQYNGCAATDTVLVTSEQDGPALSVQGAPYFCSQDTVVLIAVFDQAQAVFDGWFTEAGWYSSSPTLTMAENEGWTYVIAKAHTLNGCSTEIRVDLLREGSPSFLSISADTLGCGGTPIKVAYTFPYENLHWTWTGPNGFYQEGKDVWAYWPGYYSLTLQAGNCILQDAIQVVGQPSVYVNSFESMPPTCVNNQDGYINIWDIQGAWNYLILWSNGTVGNWVGNLGAGNYWAGITGYSGNQECYIQEDFFLPYPDSIQITLNIVNDPAGGNNAEIHATVTGAPGPYYYYWSNGATTASITGLAPGIYTLTVSYNTGFGCNASKSAEVKWTGCALEANESLHQNNVCMGESTGQITVEALNGAPPYAFLWSNGASAANLSNLANGTYVLTLTDANDCSTILETEIVAQDTLPPVLLLASLSRSLDATGHLSLNMSDFDAGSSDNCGIVSFVASPTSFDCQALGTQIIEVMATDAAGNISTGQTVLIVQDLVPPKLTCPANIVAGSCQNSVQFNLPEVSDEVCFAFDPSRLDQLTGLPAGANFPPGNTVQSLRYTKLNGLSDTCSFTVTIAPEPSAFETQITNLLCYGDCIGAIQLNIEGGTPPFSYQWFDGQTTDQLTQLCGGEYPVTVSDQFGCAWELQPMVQVPAPLQVVLDSVTNDTNSMGVGAIHMFYLGGVAPYTFAWYLDSLLVGDTPDLTGLFAGKYECILTDGNGCTVSSGLITVNNLVRTGEPVWAGGFTLIPNPATQEVQLRLPVQDITGVRIYVYDELGRSAEGVLIRKIQNGQIVLDVSNTPPGIYWVQLRSDAARASRKLVVVH